MFLKRRKSTAPQPRPAAPPAAPAALPAPPQTDPAGLNGVTLAFIGDGVYELLVRGYILQTCGGRVRELHRAAVSFSNAAFQCAAANALLPLLNEAEAEVFRRGRNAHTGHVPKNKSAAEYHAATGLEALFGWLYLKKDTARLNELFASIISMNGEIQNGKDQ